MGLAQPARPDELVDGLGAVTAAEDEVERVGQAEPDAGDGEERDEADLGGSEGEEAERHAG